jgi:hypothetical protein
MLPLGATASGESVALIWMSACGVTYCVDTTAVLFALFGSAESLLVVNVSWRLQPHLLGDRGVGGEKALSEPLL